MTDSAAFHTEHVETTGQRLIERADKEIGFLKNAIQDREAVEKMERIGFILKGPDGKYKRVSRDVKSLVQERIDSLEKSRLKLAPFAEKTFVIESDKDIHTNLRGRKLQHTLKKYSELGLSPGAEPQKVPFMFKMDDYEQDKPVRVMGDHLSEHLKAEINGKIGKNGVERDVHQLRLCREKLTGLEDIVFTVTKSQILSDDFLKQLDKMKLDLAKIKAPTRGLER